MTTRNTGGTNVAGSRDELAIRTLVVTLRDALAEISDGRYPPEQRRELAAGMLAWVRERLRRHEATARDGVAKQLAEAERLLRELERHVAEDVLPISGR
ncbi:MAG: hypothetical protein M3295_08385 [Chloroflexota bacterium]|nr:hypothetical protein [Chloroflexota bacterium]